MMVSQCIARNNPNLWKNLGTTLPPWQALARVVNLPSISSSANVLWQRLFSSDDCNAWTRWQYECLKLHQCLHRNMWRWSEGIQKKTCLPSAKKCYVLERVTILDAVCSWSAFCPGFALTRLSMQVMMSSLNQAPVSAMYSLSAIPEDLSRRGNRMCPIAS